MRGAMMRWLMILGVLLCSMHLAEPASAHVDGDENTVHLTSAQDDGEGQPPASDIVHSGHHHCPVAPDMRNPAEGEAMAPAGDLLFAAPTSRLTSRAPPPLLDPPLA